MDDLATRALKEGIASVFDRAAATYDQVGVTFFGTIAEALVRRTAPQPGERVLDLGCGRGASAIRAARAVGPTGRVLATDLAPRMVEGLRSEAVDLPWLTAEVGDAEWPPEGPWDVVQAGLVLFFLPDLAATLDRCRVALAPDGRLGFTWFGDTDESWDPVFDAIVGHLPAAERPPANPVGSGPFESVESVESLLRERGYPEVSTTQTRVDVLVDDIDQWWAWAWSHGHRRLLEAHQRNGTLEGLRDVVDPILEDVAGKGGLGWWTDVRCTLARP